MIDLDKSLIHKYWQDKIMDILTSPLPFIVEPVPDTRSRWRKAYDWLKAKTYWRFHNWLHGNCNNDY